jgi:hypothetical protein
MDPATQHALAAFPDLLEAHFAQIPPDLRNWAPPSWQGVPSEPFTPIEQLCHVRDIEVDGYHVRLTRTLNEACPTLGSLDGETLARQRNYASADASEVLKAFRAARRSTVVLVSSLREEHLARTAVFAEHGTVTLRALVHLLCSHDQQHLAGIQWLLARMSARSPA